MPSDSTWLFESKVFLHSGTVSVCSISARTEMRDHRASRLTARMVRKVWRRSSTPGTSLITNCFWLVKTALYRTRILHFSVECPCSLQSPLAPSVSTWLWLCCGINQLPIGWRNYYGKVTTMSDAGLTHPLLRTSAHDTGFNNICSVPGTKLISWYR